MFTVYFAFHSNRVRSDSQAERGEGEDALSQRLFSGQIGGCSASLLERDKISWLARELQWKSRHD